MKALKFWVGIFILVFFYRITYNLYELSHLSLEPPQMPISKQEELFLENLKAKYSFESIERNLSQNSYSYELDITLSQKYSLDIDSLTSIIINGFQKELIHKNLSIKSIYITFHFDKKHIQKSFRLDKHGNFVPPASLNDAESRFIECIYDHYFLDIALQRDSIQKSVLTQVNLQYLQYHSFCKIIQQPQEYKNHLTSNLMHCHALDTSFVKQIHFKYLFADTVIHDTFLFPKF